ncbi:hypothetical protein EPK99_09535 [Neorhizobium lilium]|uniref:Uncharacterized protein n=1 Tax=Neorhizobium lilium TaxID=2503024 RepID=A0A444LIT1_9HYPH|nr:hypothetical protein EPK99_09535 [Neorhizobium lilium]
MGVDQQAITARGTALVCLPVDRPHDPGDAADLSIMGYPDPSRDVFVRAKIAQNDDKINVILTAPTFRLLCWLKSGQIRRFCFDLLRITCSADSHHVNFSSHLLTCALSHSLIYPARHQAAAATTRLRPAFLAS